MRIVRRKMRKRQGVKGARLVEATWSRGIGRSSLFFRCPTTSQTSKRKLSNGKNNWVGCLCIVVSVVTPPKQRRLLEAMGSTHAENRFPGTPAPSSPAPHLLVSARNDTFRTGGTKETFCSSISAHQKIPRWSKLILSSLGRARCPLLVWHIKPRTLTLFLHIVWASLCIVAVSLYIWLLPCFRADFRVCCLVKGRSHSCDRLRLRETRSFKTS
ncbi:hypothetical protein IscW_ISCW020924 [Ixodes scapularis]|uniref:Transmembrane protein n=1 Tax=Ixodes scapularis TaxID=6945 RepID=B7Q9K3_IXOSC|nr:hypothetical protein IscW_ISCW020924 [Ixodes scapularis]|eukprot:XP_002406054.1 hypothetical protein IscW_ISCW020924 [Ixodes scapularis]